MKLPTSGRLGPDDTDIIQNRKFRKANNWLLIMASTKGTPIRNLERRLNSTHARKTQWCPERPKSLMSP